MTLTQRQSTMQIRPKQSKKYDAAAAYQHILTLPSSVAAQAAQKEKRSYKCGHCSTSFRRSEHCVRHERSHTLEKPFGCSVCGCHFSRKDLLVRHERTVHSSNRISPPNRSTKRQRTGSENSLVLDKIHTTQILERQQFQPTDIQSHSLGVQTTDGEKSDLDFSVLFPSVDSTDDDTLTSSPHDQDIASFPCITGEINSVFPFPGLHGFDQPLEETSSRNGSAIFREVREASCMTSIEEYIIAQASHTRPLERRGTSSSEDTQIHSQISTLAGGRRTSFIVDDTTRDWIMQDLTASYPHDLMAEFCLPNSAALQKYLDSYINNFHGSFPILHIPTFCPKDTKAPLLLAIFCIGAQHSCERWKARYLFEWTKRFLAVEDVRWRRVEVEKKAWLVRSKLLLSFFGIWSADRELVSDAVAEHGCFAGFFRSAQALLVRREEIPLQHQTWRDWVEVESIKRLCYGFYVHQSLISIAFNLPPTISCAEICLSLPVAEELWESPDSEAWELGIKLAAPDPKFTDALEYYFGAREHTMSSVLEPGPSAFGGLVLAHGLLSLQWQVSQCRHSLQLFNFATPSISPFTIAQESEKLLGRLQRNLFYTHQNISTSGGPLWFCAAGLLRQAYIRQFTLLEPTSARMGAILHPDGASVDVEAAVDYITSGSPRSMAVTRTAEKAAELLGLSITAGHFAELAWSVEHAVTGWDCILFLLRWMFTLETQVHNEWDPEEAKVYESVRRLLEESDFDLSAGGPLSPGLAGIWGDLLVDTCVWGTTSALGNGMRALSDRLKVCMDVMASRQLCRLGSFSFLASFSDSD